MTMLKGLPAWKNLADHYASVKEKHMRDLFEQDPARFEKFSLRLGDILLDYSKNRVTEETRPLVDKMADKSLEPRGHIFIAGRNLRQRGYIFEDRGIQFHDPDLFQFL